MAKTPKNHGKDWSPSDMQQLRREVKQNTPTRILAPYLGRTAVAVQQKASAEGISLKPTNQSPYGTKNR